MYVTAAAAHDLENKIFVMLNTRRWNFFGLCNFNQKNIFAAWQWKLLYCKISCSIFAHENKSFAWNGSVEI